MNKQIIQLKKQVEARKFQEVFDYLDLYFEENPYNQYSTIKMNILHQINMGFAPNPMQVQGLQIFLSSSKIKEIVPIIEQNYKNTTQQTTETMAYGIDKEIEGIRKVIDLLLEKQEFLQEELGIASGNQKFALKKQLQKLETELKDYRQKIQKLKGDNPSNSELKDLDNKTQKAQEEIKESLKEEKRSESKTSKKPPIKIFLASSSELKEDRRELREFFSLENDRMYEKGTYFKFIQWEHFLDTISDTRLQDEYNKALQDCDLVVALFFTKAGKYTEEELEKAYQYFKTTGKPKILTYFKDAPVNMNDITDEVLSLLKMKKNLADKGHFYTSYKNIAELKKHLKSQLEKLGYYG